MRGPILLTSYLLPFALLLACDGSVHEPPLCSQAPTISPKYTVQLHKGETILVEAVAECREDVQFMWAVDDTSVAILLTLTSNTAVVAGRNPGTANISVRVAEDVSYHASKTITVLKDSISVPVQDPAVCPQTYEFGNYGCARVVAVVEPASLPWPANYRWLTRMKPARAGTGAEASYPFENAPPATYKLELIRWFNSGGGVDTASVWVSSYQFDDPRPVQIGVPLSVFAADSVLHLVKFAAVGQRPQVDTVHLVMKKR